MAALRNAGNPVFVSLYRCVWHAYFIGTDDRGIVLELILVPSDNDPERWFCIHALPYKDRTGVAE